MPTQIDQALQLAIAHHQAGRLVEACQIYLQILTERPGYAEVYSNLGAALFKQRCVEQAAGAFGRAIQLRPNLLEPRLGLAAAFRELGRLPDAVVAYRQAVTIRPDSVRAHIELGHLLLRTGEMESALESYRRAVQIAPGDIDARNSLGNALTNLERFPEAESAFRAALVIDPNAGPVWNNLGNLFRVQARADEALEAYRHAIASNPQLSAAHSNLGNTLKDRGKLPEAIAALARAVELDPSSPVLHSNLVYAACFSPDQDARQILDHARRWADRHETPLLAMHRPSDNHRDPDRKLRIGYVSADFRGHVIGRNVLPILQHHDHDNFEIHCFSTLPRHDSQTADFVRAADHWHECSMLGDAELAEKVRAQKIDILVDLALHISGNRLLTFARKPAPVQLTWAGYPGTTGLRSIDCRITDPYLDPPGQTDAFYSERSVRLPHSFWCYRPMPGTPEVNSLPALDRGFVTFGCLNNSAKVTDPALNLWADVLRAVPGSHLLMLASAGSLRSEIAAFFQSKGIDPNRLDFVAPALPSEHLSRYHLIDISLDPLPYTGHTSTLDSLWMGVPVVTLSGQTCVSRGSVTALANLNLQRLIAADPQQYVTIAVELSRDLATLSELRQTLRNEMNASPLCDEAQFTRDLESVFRNLWQAWARGR